MSKIVFTTELVDRIGLLGDVMASFLEEQVNAIQERLKEKHPNVEEEAAWKTISTFSTLEGTKIPMTRSEVGEQLSYSVDEVDMMLGLFEKARILRLADGIYEIAHDTLALQISEKRSGEEKALLEIQKLVDDRYVAYVQTGALMSKKELDYIAAYEDRLPTTDAQKEFITKSERSINRRRRILIGGLITAFAIILMFAIYAVVQQGIAREKEKEAREIAVIAKKNEQEAKDQRIKAEQEQKKAIKAQREAEKQRAQAEDSKKEAERQKKDAEAQRENAIKAQREAEKQRAQAEYSKKEAETQKKEAEAQREKAVIEEEKAKKAAETAKQQAEKARIAETKAKKLRIRALASALSIKSGGMKYQDRLKGLLAMEAYSLQKSTEEPLLPPDIYSGLYSAINKFKGEGFDEIEEGHKGAVRSMLSIDDNGIYTAGSDGKVFKWDFSNWSSVGKPSHKKTLLSAKKEVDIIAARSANGEYLAIGGKTPTIEIINTKTQEKKTIEAHNGEAVYGLVFTPDGKTLISLGGDKRVRQYNMENGVQSTLMVLMLQTEALAISPDGKYLVLGNQAGFLQLYRTDNWSKPDMNVKLESAVTKLVFNEDNQQIAAGCENGAVYIFENKNGTYPKSEKPKYRKTQAQRISDIKFREYLDEKDKPYQVMVVGSYDGTVSAWNMTKFEDELYEPLSFSGNQKWVMSLSFVNEGDHLAVGYLDGKIKFWSLKADKVAVKLCEILTKKYPAANQLTASEFQQYLGDGIDRSEYKDYCE